METAAEFVQIAFAAFVALFPAVNPLGTALLVDPMLQRPDDLQRRAAARRVAIYSLAICLVTALAGSYVLKAFGLSLPVVQLAGGAVICHMGWQLLVAPPGAPPSGQDVTAGQAPDREGMLFYPVAFPMTTGPGTITVLLTLSANSHVTEPVFYVANLAALAFAAMLICGLVYVSYAYTPYALRWLNTRGYQMVARLSAFLVFCVGLQIAARGIAHLLPPLHP